MTEGKTWREAIRALKRFLVRAIWRRWQECQAQAPDATVESGPLPEDLTEESGCRLRRTGGDANRGMLRAAWVAGTAVVANLVHQA